MSTPRIARPDDVPVILELIHELAVYEREPDAVKNTPELLHSHLFGDNPRVFAHVSEGILPGGEEPVVLGFALWYLTYSTWEGTHGIHLEDLYVRPEARGGGHGKALLGELARITVERGYKRLEWSVLDWNAPAIGFYDSLGAGSMDGWTVRRLDSDALARVAAAASATRSGA
ncbi:GNAT family N-acetyltransferase [Paeniglutamicibacter cryotolerans]|uniref:Ribosomal protein S18 acetylase RimI-like enzyme n=1 Tax=Paeniglutamicibacter cryotolerans TaxID=670079 RepID=A0A839QKD1_9MICC|nr:GNAT family N-acetyltransferase [Paeniglutamicibacter cryotolerans]MBB2996848.1 ribosomal protein S18 acetylase RimI-like enzyme [Paeniglutamicibacter cryotolerans]